MKKPRFKWTPVSQIKSGDRITVRANWNVRGWCPVIRVVSVETFWFNGVDDADVSRCIGTVSRVRVWREVPQCSL